MNFIEKITQDNPLIHSGETEMSNFQVNNNSILTKEQQHRFSNDTPVCWGLGIEALKFIYDNIQENDNTLEIGSGLTTLVFAQKKTNHICITPNEREIKAISDYAKENSLDLNKVEFINEYSEVALPKLNENKSLNLILIDGKHAFPWPFIDWFYTVNHLKKDGILLVDDIHLITGRILCDFMKKDYGWDYVTTLNNKTAIFRNKSDNVRNVAWHMQPYITDDYLFSKKKNNSLVKKIINKIKSYL